MELLTETNFNGVEAISESLDNGQKQWFIEGVFMEADVVNRNKRIYPGPIMESAVNSYVSEYVNTKRAVGELQHPPTTEINLANVSHIIESIRKQGKQYIGKAKIVNTPSGNIARGLLESGVKLGVSSRALGALKKNKQGINEVQANFRLATIDIVYQPSAPNAFVDGLMEGQTIWNTICEDEEYLEQIKEGVRQANATSLQEAKITAFEQFIAHLKHTK